MTAAALSIEAAQSSDGRTYLKIRSHNKLAAMFLLGRHLALSQHRGRVESEAGDNSSDDAHSRDASSGDAFAQAMAEARERYA